MTCSQLPRAPPMRTTRQQLGRSLSCSGHAPPKALEVPCLWGRRCRACTPPEPGVSPPVGVPRIRGRGCPRDVACSPPEPGVSPPVGVPRIRGRGCPRDVACSPPEPGVSPPVGVPRIRGRGYPRGVGCRRCRACTPPEPGDCPPVGVRRTRGQGCPRVLRRPAAGIAHRSVSVVLAARVAPVLAFGMPFPAFLLSR